MGPEAQLMHKRSSVDACCVHYYNGSMTDLPGLDAECFFIAPIGDEGTRERDRSDGILEFIVQQAAAELGLVAVRADQIGRPGQITLQVLDHVLGAKAAVADLTELNPNVFYELAVRHTARLPVVLIADKNESLPFDIAQMRTVFFDHTDLRSANACRTAIVSQLKEAFSGAVDSPIATTVDVKALQGGNTVERNTADLVQAVEQLAQMQKRLLSLFDEFRSDISLRPTMDARVSDAVDHAFRRMLELRQYASKRQDSGLSSLIEQVDTSLEYAVGVIAAQRYPMRVHGERSEVFGRFSVPTAPTGEGRLRDALSRRLDEDSATGEAVDNVTPARAITSRKTTAEETPQEGSGS